MRIRSQAAIDWLIVLSLVGLSAYDLWTNFANTPGSPVLIGALLLAVSLPLAWRRRAPFAVLAIVMSAYLALNALFASTAQGSAEAGLAALVAIYSLAVHEQERRVSGAAVAALSIGAASLIELLAGQTPGNVLPAWIFYALAWIIGRGIREREQLALSLEDRAARLEREREEKAQAAVSEERARIARELHDVIAHSLSLIVVQAGSEQRVLGEERPSTREVLHSIEQTGRDALGELRRLLGILRRSDDGAELTPPPSLRNIDALVAQARKAGLPVELRIEGAVTPLPPGADLSAYRIVQEGLTNVLKHAGPARAEVVVRYGERRIELEVRDDGRGEADGGGAGRGLIGMRERTTLYGGEFDAGPVTGGGYRITANLPLRPAGR